MRGLRFATGLAFALLLPAVSGPAAEIWCPNQLEPVYEGPDYAGKDDPQCELRLSGARGGSFSAQAVVFSKEPVAGAEARASALKSADGKSIIPASAVEVRYALPTGVNGINKMPAGTTGIFDALDVKPRETGSVHPVWVTVNVPAAVAPGDYEGRLSVAGRDVPVKLSVAPWVVPAPADWATWIDFIESPESVALRYDMKLWSEEHWEAVGKVWDQLAKVGNKTIYIPLMCQTHFGNSESMVRWVPKARQSPEGDGGKAPLEFTHDFSIAEKYLDARIKHAGKPAVVVLYIHENMLGGSHGRTAEECQRGVPFTLVDPKTGEVTTAEGPCHNGANPAYPNYPDDTVAFWKPVIEGLHERLKARGIGDERIMLGMSNDLAPGKNTLKYLSETFPWARWCHQGHGLLGKQGPIAVGYDTTVWMAQGAKSAAERNYGWRRWKHYPESEIVAHFDRDIWKADFPVQLVRGRLISEMNITGHQRGVGRLSADFWSCIKDQKGNMHSIVNRYPLSNWAQLTVRNTPHLYAGQNGPLATVRFEMIREGLQECEARIFIEKAFLDAEKRAQIGDELAARVQAVLDARMLDDKARAEMIRHLGGGASDALRAACADYAKSDWQKASAALYAAAAEVAAKLEK